MESRKIYIFLICITALCGLFFTGVSSAQAPPPGEEELFSTTQAPDAMILLDLSGSMDDNPAGTSNRYGNSSCSGTFYSSSGSGHTTDCRKVEIAKRAVFGILDDNNDGKIDSSDATSLNVRVGFMRFKDGDDTAGNWSSGNVKVMCPIGSQYSRIYCGSSTQCSSTVSSCGSGTCSGSGSECIVGYSANGGTPLASALNEAKLYLDANKAGDAAKDCRKKFLIVISDGSDTYACGGDGMECKNSGDSANYSRRFKGRRNVVAQTKALADAGYKVFVIGFGSVMPTYLQNTLNWMAYYGGTDNPNVVNAGGTAGYNITTGCDLTATPPVTAPCCDVASNPTACYPSGVSSCAPAEPVTTAFKNTMLPETCEGTSYTQFYAPSNDPGNTPLSGYAFLAADADALASALKTAFNTIRAATYSFTQASVQSSRTTDENFLYEASFEPVAGEPFWHGHLEKYQINSDGSIGTNMGDAGAILQAASASSRTMKTCIAGSMTSFTTSIARGYFDVTADSERDNIVGYIRGDSSYNPDSTTAGVYKLGDVFRSTPITVGTPSVFFDDMRDQNNAFATHRTNHIRTSAIGNRVIVVGANDGQLHAFKTSNLSEAWSFIPPSHLPKLKYISHQTNPTALTHQYYVDGAVTVADVWLGPSGQDGTSKNASDWKTILIFGEGRGGTPMPWSSSQYCDSGFSSLYSTSYPYYCGYYALGLNNSLSPTFMWHLGGTNAINPAHAPYLSDESWSKMMIGRVMINNMEKWVGFVGAGYSGSDCSGGGGCGAGCDCRGKGFFVIDLSNGQILWSYTYANNTAKMIYGIPAAPAIVDTDNDGFIDTVYVGDMGGNVWRYKFCTAIMSALPGGCSTSDWSGRLFFDGSTVDPAWRPIYTIPSVARDGAGNLWVLWGSGNKADPASTAGRGRLFALKDNDRTTTWFISNMDDISSAGSTYDQTTSLNKGFYISLSGTGEKVLADSALFGGVVYFTSYSPISSSPCAQSGNAYLYAINFPYGSGAFSGGSRSMSIGVGIASAPVISVKPPGSGSNIADLYVTTSTGGAGGSNTQRVNFNPPGLSNRVNILNWRDRRIQ